MTDAEIIAAATPYSMTGEQRLQSVIDAVRYLVANGIDGDFAECGVWRGGSVLAMILTLQELGAEREVHLFDTFAGMTEPTEHDVSAHEPPARESWEGTRWNGLFGADAYSEDQVRATLAATGYERLHFHVGPVEETVPAQAPHHLALLRLDTDWYASTRHELEHLYPRLATGGVLIIDDYGHWDGARRAVDEYFGDTPPLLARIDYTGRMAVKPG